MVAFRLPTGESLFYKGSSIRVTPRVVLTLKAKKMIHYEAWTFLASVTVDGGVKPIVSSVPVVRELEDVFPKDLPRLPPNKYFILELTLSREQRRFPRHRIE